MKWLILCTCLLALSPSATLSAAEQAPENTLGMRFVRIAAGEYIRGFDPQNCGRNQFALAHMYSNSQEFKHESPAHRVQLTRGFDLGTTEVTVGQFTAFVEATGYQTDAQRNSGALGFFPAEKNYVDRFHVDPKVTWQAPGFEQSANHPVVCVSWNDCIAFCQWLSKKEGTTYRLPTEAQWEYACRAGTQTWYSWGDDPDPAYQHANVADAALENAHENTTRFQRAVRLKEGEGDGVVFTAPVASFAPNPWQLYDMHGNVWEWCQDRWSDDVYERYFDNIPRTERDRFIATDPLFDKQTDQHKYGDWHVLRGGAWTCAPAAVRSSIRTFAEAADASVYTGFRVVRELD